MRAQSGGVQVGREEFLLVAYKLKVSRGIYTLGVLQRDYTRGILQGAYTLGVLQRAYTLRFFPSASTHEVLELASAAGLLLRDHTCGRYTTVYTSQSVC